MAKKNKKKSIYPVLTGLELLKDDLYVLQDILEILQQGRFVGEYPTYFNKINQERSILELRIEKIEKYG